MHGKADYTVGETFQNEINGQRIQIFPLWNLFRITHMVKNDGLHTQIEGIKQMYDRNVHIFHCILLKDLYHGHFIFNMC